MDKFIEELRIYCETVEDTKGLEIIKDNIFSCCLNLEYMNDYVEYIGDSFEEQIQGAEITVNNIQQAIKEAEKIANTDKRECFKLLKGKSKTEIKDLLDFVLHDSYEYLCEKYNHNEPLATVELLDNEVEQWYKDLYNLFEKYDI